MPDHPRSAHPAVSATSAAAAHVRVAGLAVADAPNDARLPIAQRALGEAQMDPRDLVAVISIDDGRESASGMCAQLGLGGAAQVRALDLGDDGCGVPSSIAIGGSLLAQWGGAVLLTVRGGAAVLRGMPGTASPGGATTAVGRRTADVKLTRDGPRTAVEQVLATVSRSVPIVAVVPGGLRLSPERRFVSVSLAAGGAAPIEGLMQARAEGCSRVVLVTANDHGRAAAVICALDAR